MNCALFARLSQYSILGVFFVSGSGCGGGLDTQNTEPRIVTDPAKMSVTSQWKQYSDSRFEMLFPWGGNPVQRPHIGRKPEGVRDIIYYQAEQRKSRPQEDGGGGMTYLFGVGVVLYDRKITETIRQEARQKLFPKLTGAETKEVTWGDKPCKEYSYENHDTHWNQNVKCRYRVLELEYIDYVGYVHDFGRLTTPEIDRFFGSFQLKAPPPPRNDKTK